MYRDRDVQRQRESGYMWMCKAGRGNDWTGVQRSGMELTEFFFDGPSSSLMTRVLLWWPKFIRNRFDWSEHIDLTDQSTLIHFIIIHCNTFWTLTLTWTLTCSPEWLYWSVWVSGYLDERMDGWMDGHSSLLWFNLDWHLFQNNQTLLFRTTNDDVMWCDMMWCDDWLTAPINQFN